MKSFIKIIVFHLMLVVLFATASAQTENIDKFTQGVEFYSDGKFTEAAEVWMELYNTGYRSAALNYNIANAYFKSAYIPQAILFYERAHLLAPLNEDINYNLQVARTFAVDRFQEIPEIFFVRWFNIAALLISSNSWAIIGIVAFVVCLVAVSLYIYSFKYLHKVIGFWVAVFCLVISMTSIVLSSKNNSLINNSRKAIIFSPAVSGKSSPDTSGSDLFILHEGTKVSIEEKIGEWLEIRLPDGNKGWIPANCLEVI
jgi:tetratricopeptide (TPR) repeat protein